MDHLTRNRCIPYQRSDVYSQKTYPGFQITFFQGICHFYFNFANFTRFCAVGGMAVLFFIARLD